MSVFLRFKKLIRRSPGSSSDSSTEGLQYYLSMGIMACGLLFAALFIWGALFNISGAVIAQGVLVVESHLKKIQHATGGIIEELNVRDGSEVKEGDVLIRLDPTVAETSLAIVTKALYELEGRRARLEAERDGTKTMIFPEDLLKKEEETEKIRKGEEDLFISRETAHKAEKEQFQEQIAQMEEQIRGFETQKKLIEEQMKVNDKELQGVTYLYKKKLSTIQRLSALQNEKIDLNSRHAQTISGIADLRGKIAEINLRILQFDKDIRAEILKELGETQGRMEELYQRKIAAEDELNRIDIRAPQDGVVHDLVVHTVGGVIKPGETLMDIVPKADKLIIEAHVSPDKIDQLKLDQSAIIRLSAFNQRTTPEFSGHVTFISGDLTKNAQTGESYYTVRIALSPDKTLNTLTLVPGMPAEAFIQTENRSPLSFLFKPLTDQIKRAFRER